MGLAALGANSFDIGQLQGGAPIPAANSKLRIVDMNATTGGVARGTSISTTYVTLFQYNGSGLLFGWLITCASFSSNWQVQCTIDGVDLFEGGGILTSDMYSNSVYNIDSTSARESFVGLAVLNNSMRFECPRLAPILYASSVVIKARRVTTNQNFNAGLVVLSKET